MQPGRPHPAPPQALQPKTPASLLMGPPQGSPRPHPPLHAPELQPPRVALPHLPDVQPPVAHVVLAQLPDEQPPVEQVLAQPVNMTSRPASDPINSQRFIAESFPISTPILQRTEVNCFVESVFLLDKQTVRSMKSPRAGLCIKRALEPVVHFRRSFHPRAHNRCNRLRHSAFVTAWFP